MDSFYLAIYTQGRLLIPADALQSPEAQQNATRLVHAGVQIRTLTTPAVHAKLIVTAPLDLGRIPILVGAVATKTGQ